MLLEDFNHVGERSQTIEDIEDVSTSYGSTLCVVEVLSPCHVDEGVLVVYLVSPCISNVLACLEEEFLQRFVLIDGAMLRRTCWKAASRFFQADSSLGTSSSL